MSKTTCAALAAALVFGTAGSAFAVPEKPECLAPAKPGGGFDLTCKLVQSALQNGNYLPNPMRVTYMPGGIGAVAYNTVIAQRPAEAGTIVAFSGGSVLNLAIGKFGKYNENDVKWLAAAVDDRTTVGDRAGAAGRRRTRRPQRRPATRPVGDRRRAGAAFHADRCWASWPIAGC